MVNVQRSIHVLHIAGVVVHILRAELDVVEVELTLWILDNALAAQPVVALLELLLGDDSAQVLWMAAGRIAAEGVE